MNASESIFKQALVLIRRYERSVGIDEEASFEKRYKRREADPDIKLSCLEYAERCKEYLRAGAEIDAVMDFTHPVFDAICMLKDSTEIMTRLGCENYPVLYTKRHLRSAMLPKETKNRSCHGLSIAQLKQIPELLENPVAAIDSPDKRTIVFVLETVDNDGLPMVVPIRPNGKGMYGSREIKSNFILSVYGHDTLERYLDYAVAERRVLYFNAEKGERLCSLSRVQFPGALQNLSNSIIQQSKSVNCEKPENSKKLSNSKERKGLNNMGHGKKR